MLPIPYRKSEMAVGAPTALTASPPRLLLSAGEVVRDNGKHLSGSFAWSERSEPSSEGNKTKDTNTFLNGLKPAVTLAQWFGLLPVSKPSNPEEASFRWKSFRVAYSFVIIIGSSIESIFSLLRMFEVGVTFLTSVNVMFYTTSAVTSIIFINLSISWKHTFSYWSRLERHLAASYGNPPRLTSNMGFMTAIILSLAALEHALSLASSLAHVWPCYDRGGIYLLLEGFFILKYRKTFTVVSYSLFRGSVLFCLQIVTTFIWNFSDLFVTAVSMGLSALFRQLNCNLDAARGKIKRDDYWRQKREDFNTVATLTRTISGFIGPVVLISYASNLYFICLQLILLAKRPNHTSVIHDVYFFFSFTYLLGRTGIMSLLAADVFIESQKPRPVLFSVPTFNFCREVQRFLIQVNTESVAITGCDFFSITRSFMLTVAGTIVTYIVILVQFDSAKEDQDTPNKTIACTCQELGIYDC